MSRSRSVTAFSRTSREVSSDDSRSISSVWLRTTSPKRRTRAGAPVMPTVPTTVPSSMTGSVMPGRTPASRRACSAVCVRARSVRTTSTDASWNVPTRDGSPLPSTVPSRSVIITLWPMIAVVSLAISWASDGVSTAPP